MLRFYFLYLALFVGIAVFGVSLWSRAETRVGIPAPKDDVSLAQHPGKETAVFAGGCFWGTQAVFERVRGVLDDRRWFQRGCRPSGES